MSTSLRMATPVQRSLRVGLSSATISQVSSRWTPQAMRSRSPGSRGNGLGLFRVQPCAATQRTRWSPRATSAMASAAPRQLEERVRLAREDVRVSRELDQRDRVVQSRGSSQLLRGCYDGLAVVPLDLGTR